MDKLSEGPHEIEVEAVEDLSRPDYREQVYEKFSDNSYNLDKVARGTAYTLGAIGGLVAIKRGTERIKELLESDRSS